MRVFFLRCCRVPLSFLLLFENIHRVSVKGASAAAVTPATRDSRFLFLKFT